MVSDLVRRIYLCPDKLLTFGASQGEGIIADYAMATLVQKLRENLTPTPTQQRESMPVRWLAPEVIMAQSSTSPKSASDTYSFGMAILEMLTENVPFAEYSSDMAIIRALMKNEQPKRPVPAANQEDPITDTLWNLMVRCWSREPESRPTMWDVVKALEAA
ncbi:Proto-oncogene tyrosine-protein kinase ROS [Leucoagaricus sp. SymC.cos]|nr:Proto-oncogene tyrosine-protein kinase ROS [Leucoagaricus sp. SymC.cos]